MFASNQPSSVIIQRASLRLVSCLCFGVRTERRQRREELLLGETAAVAALLVCVGDQCEISTLWCHCDERQLSISLIISGMICCQWAVDGGGVGGLNPPLPVSRVR